MSNFLKAISAAVAVEQPVIARKASVGGPRKEWNPTVADIRLWSTGKVFPSQKLVDQMNLEFPSRTIDETTGKWSDKPGGFGFDVFDTENYPAIKNARFAAIASVLREEGRIDLFASCGYYTKTDEAEGNIPEGMKVGDPIVSVMDQGSNTFGKELLVMLNTIYGVVPNEAGYIDLEIHGLPDATGQEQPFRNPNGSPIYLVPKTMTKGDKAGEMTYVRRENINIFALVPVEGTPTGTLVTKGDNKTDVAPEEEVPTANGAALEAAALA